MFVLFSPSIINRVVHGRMLIYLGPGKSVIVLPKNACLESPKSVNEKIKIKISFLHKLPKIRKIPLNCTFFLYLKEILMILEFIQAFMSETDDRLSLKQVFKVILLIFENVLFCY